MAKVWMVKEGSDPAKGGPWRTMPLAECCEKLGLETSNFLSDLTTIPKFGETSKPPAMFTEARHVVVQIDDDEAAQHGWNSGFYLSDLTPKEAEQRCAPKAEA